MYIVEAGKDDGVSESACKNISARAYNNLMQENEMIHIIRLILDIIWDMTDDIHNGRE